VVTASTTAVTLGLGLGYVALVWGGLTDNARRVTAAWQHCALAILCSHVLLCVSFCWLLCFCIKHCSQLSKLLHDFGPHLTAAHCASAISLLAGMATRQQQQQQFEETYQAPAARAAELLTARIGQASLMDCAR
jgi:hypothetical protein